jgi:hypothetical protein
VHRHSCCCCRRADKRLHRLRAVWCRSVVHGTALRLWCRVCIVQVTISSSSCVTATQLERGQPANGSVDVVAALGQYTLHGLWQQWRSPVSGVSVRQQFEARSSCTDTVRGALTRSSIPGNRTFNVHKGLPAGPQPAVAGDANTPPSRRRPPGLSRQRARFAEGQSPPSRGVPQSSSNNRLPVNGDCATTDIQATTDRWRCASASCGRGLADTGPLPRRVARAHATSADIHTLKTMTCD